MNRETKAVEEKLSSTDKLIHTEAFNSEEYLTKLMHDEFSRFYSKIERVTPLYEIRNEIAILCSRCIAFYFSKELPKSYDDNDFKQADKLFDFLNEVLKERYRKLRKNDEEGNNK